MSSVVAPMLSALSEYTGYKLTLLAGRVETDPKVDVKVVACADPVTVLKTLLIKFPGYTLEKRATERSSLTGMQRTTTPPFKVSRVLYGVLVSEIELCSRGVRLTNDVMYR
jgi:hypothetical protein